MTWLEAFRIGGARVSAAAGPLMGGEIAGWPGRARATFSSGHVLDRPCDGAAMVSPVANDPLVRLEML